MKHRDTETQRIKATQRKKSLCACTSVFSFGMTQWVSRHLRCLLVLSFIISHFSFSVAQITIGGNVYGGGNVGATGGNANVTVHAGDINRVFGGARQADVDGHAFVHIDGEHASDYIVINYLFGGNDITGNIGSSTKPAQLTQDEENSITDDWNAFVRISSKADVSTNKSIYIGQLFGGGNGDYDYISQKLSDGETPNPYYDMHAPDLGKTYLELLGGSIVYAYGGGNNATVTDNTVICLDNPSEVVNSIIDTNNPHAGTGGEVLTDERFSRDMGINIGFSQPSSDAFQIGRFFGGNNKAEMSIRPLWNLKNGKVRNLYSGGNQGRMTCPEGLLLEIPTTSTVKIDNVYGGCRMADVIPMDNGTPISARSLPGYQFPEGFSARVLVRGGHINNVYGGNDITGKVYGGNAVGIYTTIYGDVYGGGNGAYPYTDNIAMRGNSIYGDFYYDPLETNPETGAAMFSSSVDALNAFRPNAEQVSIRVVGTETKKTIVLGSIFIGGNCATLNPNPEITNPLAELKIGSYAICDNVFLGNNGENMVKSNDDPLLYNRGVLYTMNLPVTVENFGVAGSGKFNSINLLNENTFATYMDGVAMNMLPRVVFDDKNRKPVGDPDDYEPYTSYFGSFYCGGNVGSMKVSGKTTIDFSHKVIIYNKLVGGCNSADVAASSFNAAYSGGLLLDPDASGNKLELNLSGLKIQPKRWQVERDGNYEIVYRNAQGTVTDKDHGDVTYILDNNGNALLEWNTIYSSTGKETAPVTTGYNLVSDDYDVDRRLTGGNVYGGCYSSGHVNGNVVINLNETVVDRKGPNAVFDHVLEDDGEAKLYENDSYHILERKSGVIIDEQGMDVLGSALNVFGGGYGNDTEIWGSVTINLNAGYIFQIFGGGENGVIGKADDPEDSGSLSYSFNGKTFRYNPKYSCTINVKGASFGVARGADGDNDNMAEAEFIYGGGFQGPICGNTTINLGNGRVFNTFAGSCYADILGHTETYMGRNTSDDSDRGFPWVRDHIYGGNDLGGSILGSKDFTSRVSSDILSSVHGYDAGTSPLLTASAYTEYVQGHVEYIFGGCYGDYDYATTYSGYAGRMPQMANTFVNFRPNSHNNNGVSRIFGAGQGQGGQKGKDKMQDHSYVLIDIPQSLKTYKDMKVFGGGAYCGLGMRLTPEDALANLDNASAIIDLMRGQLSATFGGSWKEGVTRRTVVNVPANSTIEIDSIFGGALGTEILPPCDVYQAIVNYLNTSENARVYGAIYGGNNNERRSLYTQVNINCPVWSNKERGYMAKVYGAGKGLNTWSEYTEVNLLAGAQVFEVYGGSEMGHVLNAESVQKYMQLYKDTPSPQISAEDPKWSNPDRWVDTNGDGKGDVGGTLIDDGNHTLQKEWQADWLNAWTLEGYYTPNPAFDNYVTNGPTNLTNSNIVHTRGMDDRDYTGYTVEAKARIYQRYNTNVIINEGAYVANYAYGGGWGESSTPRSGDIYGTTYIALLGGSVKKDIYAAGTSGGVYNIFETPGATTFTASANAYIKGGVCRNVYGGGWEGDVGNHSGGVNAPTMGDIDGETHVVIGDANGTSFINGIPTIERNAYGGGEGGAVWGTANITLNNGYIGYRYFADEANADPSEELLGIADGGGYYQEKLHDETWSDGKGLLRLYDSGNIFGGGYIDNSTVDKTCVMMMGGTVRGSLFGGGEIAAIGRGIIDASGENNSVRTLHGIYKAGHTSVKLYEGHVHRNVFGGGRGYNNLGQSGTLYSDGYVFGQTEVNIYGGEVGTDEELAKGNGNVFGGGDIGYVYSAYEEDGKLYVGIKDGERYDNKYEGYYYAYDLEYNLAPEDYIPYIPANYVYDEHDPKWVMIGDEYILTEDTKVLIEPWCKVISQVKNEQEEYVNVTINGHEYAVGAYVPTDDLQYLENKNADAERWACLDDKGITIHNAVFAGGNTSAGSSMVFANATSIFGNSTASIHDVFHRDLITVGTGHTGGLYGDGNLTFVDGYRGLNITNYGTDYYFTKPEISIETYRALPAREAAYYELRYQCKISCKDKDDTQYTAGTIVNGALTGGSTISADDLNTLFQDVYFNSSNVTQYSATPLGDGWTPMLNANGTPNDTFWAENGVCSRYAGRLMNTIQRADFCGVFGSRMVMEGAQDRVPEIVDHTNYTINRVREVSLNQQHSVIPTDLTLKDGKSKVINFPEDQNPYDFADMNKAVHGNYFGIFGIVNYLGALTSDVHFMPEKDVRVTDNTDAAKYKCDSEPYSNGGTSMASEQYGTASYYDWKAGFVHDRKRNNATSLNKVALASGVYLELTTEKSTGDGLYEKDWGYITGVIELDLINVQPGIGGGFVYAKNEHRVGTYSKKNHATLTKLNEDAITQKDFVYDGDYVEWETSGNFVHSSQIIIDDCYNVSNKYQGDGAMPAHYWYIKGSVYVYDQYISAYTGAPNAYSETVEIPLTITAASHGTMKLLNVMPNKYAYYSSPGVTLENDKRVIINDVTYYKNDPISYWDWFLLSKSERDLFVDSTYVVIADCKIGNTEYKEGTVLLPSEYNAIRGNSSTPPEVLKKVDNNDDTPSWVSKDDFTFDFVFRQTNNLRHDTGYLLTYEVNNPTKWDKWYTEFNSSTHYKKQDAANDNDYNSGPTYYLTNNTGSVLGQREYAESNIISEDVYNTYQGIVTNHSSALLTIGQQATFVPAYIVTQDVTVNEGATKRHWYEGAVVSQTYMSDPSHDMTASTAPAYICTSTIQLSNTEFIYLDTKMTEADKTNYITRVTTEINGILPEAASESITKLSDLNLTGDALTRFNNLSVMQKNRLSSLLLARNDIKTNIVPAYYCTVPGLYGGNYYEGGKNYRGLEAWSSMSPEDRSKFTFNYDALDLFIDSHYTHPEGQKYQYDSSAGDLAGAEANPAGYSLIEPIEYTATYNGDDPLQYTTDGGASATATKAAATELSRTEYERLPNEKRHYSSIKVEAAGTYYVVNAPFQVGSTTYAAGNTISESAYNSLLSEDQAHITRLKFEENQTGTYYFCREAYTIDNVEGKAVTSLMTAGSGDDLGKMVLAQTGTNISIGSNVSIGTVISQTDYSTLVNKQKDFTIHGIAPTETSTLYVSRNSDIYDLSEDKIITVIYQYDYEESDSEGNIVPVSERHVVNIHLQFKSGIPLVEDIREPELILPGDNVALREPSVTPGAYEIMGGGWELFENIDDAERHTNGITFTPNFNPLYWYQDGYYVAYYALTYLGKTYSNHVPVSVANYHDLQLVMADTVHHYYVDNPNVKRDSKIYINNYTTSDPATSQNGLNLLKQFYDLSLLHSTGTDDGHLVTLDGNGLITGGDFKGHALLNNHVRAADNLEFFLRTDLSADLDDSAPSGFAAWTPIATDNCFAGTLHGDGHTISGLDCSLFDHLCGDVYNLGVTGLFTEAGIANTGDGYIENCWIQTTAPSGFASGVNPVFGTPTRNEYEPVANGTTLTNGATYYTSSDGAGEFTAVGTEVSNGTNYFQKQSIIQVVNCYYPESNNYSLSTVPNITARGVAIQKPDKAFYNGEVTFDLNGFYLYKRYCDNTVLSGSATEYKYWLPGNATPQTGRYGSNPDLCSAGYVEDRFADGDFIYAGGSIPDSPNERIYTYQDNNNTITAYYPIWPDDYLFFGQMLSYGYVDSRPHQPLPAIINRSDDRVATAVNTSNRVYRAPAYFRSSDMSVAHYNNYAIFAKQSADGTQTAYPGMTAIDFTGGNGDVLGGYKLGNAGANGFYQPLLDHSTLIAFRNIDLTRNLLAYADLANDAASHAVIESALPEATYTFNASDEYKRVPVPADASSVNGHLVTGNSTTGYTAGRNHYLVDKEDFNCPISYTFGSDYMMWYQREPDKFVDLTKGWDAVSLPFSPILVSTQDKGELTHFYSGSTTGHEYWLREFTGIGATDASTVTAVFTKPGAGANTKEYTNTFLYDHYYINQSGLDANTDVYQSRYYSSPHTFTDYPYPYAARPYLLGLPGPRYYEFDLSGTWTPLHTAQPAPTKVGKQTVSFVSDKGVTIGVSDTEIAQALPEQTNNKYTFTPTYMSRELAASEGFVLNDEGSAFSITTDATTVLPFRPYFTHTSPSRGVQHIIFGNESTQFGVTDDDGRSSDGLAIYARRRTIVVESSMSRDTDVTIVSPEGVELRSFTIQPGETVTTRVSLGGVYIINSKKLIVR